MNPVLESTKFVVEHSKYVKIHNDKIDEFAKTFTREHTKHWWKDAPVDLSNLTEHEKLHFLLVFNSLSFSYWGDPTWSIEYPGKKTSSASFCLIYCIKRALDEGKPLLDPRYLAKLTRAELAHILRANVEIPLLDERLKTINQVGYVLVQKYDADFSNMVKEADKDALKLVKSIITNFPLFDDTATYKGKTIFFYKRAQLIVSDVHLVFDGKGLSEFKNADEITAFADYKLPQVLRKLGIFSYTQDLMEKIDNKILIPKGSEEEVEIRANTIWAVELIKEKVREKIPGVDSVHVNDHLWLSSGKIPTTDKPYHRTRTTFY